MKLQTQTGRQFHIMKRSTKIILVASVVGTLGLSGLVKIANARQLQSQVAVMPQHHQNSLVRDNLTESYSHNLSLLAD